MNPKFDQLSSLFFGLKPRERALAIAAALGIIYFLFDVALIKPQKAQAKVLRETIAQQETEIAAVTTALQALRDAKRNDPLAAQRQERDALRGTLTAAEAVMARASSDVRMGEVIRTITAATPGLTLVSLKTLPVESFFTAPAAIAPGAAAAAAAATAASQSTAPRAAASAASAPAAPMSALYKHGVDVTVQGRYVNLIPYLQGLERNARGVFWGDIKLDVLAYPDATLKMTVYTLSALPELPLN